MKIEEKLTIGDLIDPKHLDEFKGELGQLLQKMYMEGYDKGYQDGYKVAAKLISE